MTDAYPIKGPEEKVFETPFTTVRRVHLDFGTHKKTLYVTDPGQRAAVVIRGERGILLTRQYRYLIDALSWEIPGGKFEAGELPMEGARRECLEETGLRCRDLRLLLVFQPGLDTYRNPTHVFLSEDFETIDGAVPHAEEVSGLVWVPFEKCIEMIHQGQIVDALSIVSLLFYQSSLLPKRSA
jgi:ADP-ribose pyrophosphatase